MSDGFDDAFEKLYKDGYRAGFAAAKAGAVSLEMADAPAAAHDARLAYDARFPNASRLGYSSGYASSKPAPATVLRETPEQRSDRLKRFPNADRLHKGG